MIALETSIQGNIEQHVQGNWSLGAMTRDLFEQLPKLYLKKEMCQISKFQHHPSLEKPKIFIMGRSLYVDSEGEADTSLMDPSVVE